MCECAVYRPVLTSGLSPCEGPLCELLPTIILFGQGDEVSEVERKGNTVRGAGLGHCPSVSWKTLMGPFLKMGEKVALNEE